MKIYAPVKDFNGVRIGVRFVEGVGETDDKRKIAWFEQQGYEVVNDTPITTDTVAVDESEFVGINEIVEDEYEPIDDEFEHMTPYELREWAKEHGHGVDIGNLRNRVKLLKLVRGWASDCERQCDQET